MKLAQENGLFGFFCENLPARGSSFPLGDPPFNGTGERTLLLLLDRERGLSRNRNVYMDVCVVQDVVVATRATPEQERGLSCITVDVYVYM